MQSEKRNRLKIVVSGLGAKCSLGENIDSIWESIERGKLGISQIDRFDVSGYRSNLGSMIINEGHFEDDTSLLMHYGNQAAREAIKRAKISDLSKLSLAIGISNSIHGKEINFLAKHLAKELGLGGIVFTVSTACASSAHCIGIGLDLIRSGKTDIVLCGGVDLLNEDVFAGFTSLGLLSEKPCAPFSTQMGTTLGEGAAFMVLEREASAIKRMVNPIAICKGFGHSADAYHDTTPDPKGLGMARAISSALKDAALDIEDIDYINAHGTGTQANDSSEWRAIQKVFGDYAKSIPVSSSKSFLGHTQGVAGAMEAVVSLMAMNRNKIPSTHNLENSRPYSPDDPVKGKYPRDHIVDHFLSTNAAFGGVNTALIFSRYNYTSNQSKEPIMQRPIGLSIASTVGETSVISRQVPASELRTMDKSALLLASSVSGILSKLKLQPRSRACMDIGLFVGQSNVSAESHDNFRKSIAVLGYKNLSAHAFTKMVVNYATGATGKIFGLKGPTVTVSTVADSGLTALLFASNHMICHPEFTKIIAAGVEEKDNDNTYPDKSTAVLLSSDQPSVFYLTSWNISKHIDEAISLTLNNAGYATKDIEHINIEGLSSTAGLNTITSILTSDQNNYNKPILLSQQKSENFAIALIIEKKP